MKKISFFMMMLLAVWGFQACNNTGSRNDSVDNADSINDANNPPVSDDASDFMVKAANGGMMEVQLGQIAQDKAQSQRVKDFGAMMVRDHSKANNELKQLAASKNVTLPDSVSSDTRQDMDKLNEKTGSDFDEAYMDMMVDDHKKDINEFEKAANNLNDPEVKNWASQTLPTLRSHLDSAQAINDMFKNR